MNTETLFQWVGYVNVTLIYVYTNKIIAYTYI